jgi:hypothetical protein
MIKLRNKCIKPFKVDNTEIQTKFYNKQADYK